MKSRSLVSGLVALLITFTSGASFASEASDRDDQLMQALSIIASRNSGWTAEDWQEFGYTAAKYALIVAGVAGAGTALYYFKGPIGFKAKSLLPSTETMEKTGSFIANHGGTAAVGVVTTVVAGNIVSGLPWINNVSESERLRNAATPDARVYRTHLKYFFKLSLSEQFLTAQQDPALIQDIFRLARLIVDGKLDIQKSGIPDSAEDAHVEAIAP